MGKQAKSLTQRGIELRERRKEIKDQLGAMAEKLREEKRARTEDEEKEYTDLVRDLQISDMELRSLADTYDRTAEDPMRDAEKMVRDALSAGRPIEFKLTRDVIMVSDANSGGIVPLRMQDIIKPLEEGLILHKLGLPFKTGLSGEFFWPSFQKIEAQIAGEGVAINDQKINFSKLNAKPERFAVSVGTTRESVMQTDGLVESIIREAIPMAITRLVNQVMFSTDKVANASEIAGPFVALKASAKQIGPALDFKTLNTAKAELLATGIDGEKLCWVMTKAQQAILEATPKDAGSGIMVCEDDKICGIPVFTTHFIGEGYIGLGDWQYQPMGLFGDTTFIVDPYSGAKSNTISYTFNTHYATATLRTEAFKLFKVKDK